MHGSTPSASDLLVALNAASGLSRASICRLAAELDVWFPAPRRPLKRLAAELGLSTGQLNRALGLVPHAAQRASAERQRAAELGARVVTRGEPGFPEALLEVPLPPPVLYLRGQIPEAPAVAIVGSRAPDDYGREAAAFFGHHLAKAGVVVVSGFARGIDVAAHRAALEVPGGTTVAVLGCGIDVHYPTGHWELGGRIAAGRGALVSEFPPGTPPAKPNFPVRNRIIAALGTATLVVQASARSGSLITARHALELGRELFALPGRIFDETALGPNALLRDGCRPALHPADLIQEALGARGVSGSSPAVTCRDGASEPPPPLPGLGARVWMELPPGRSLAAEELASRVDASVQGILGSLLELELGGWIERLPGPVYRRRRMP